MNEEERAERLRAFQPRVLQVIEDANPWLSAPTVAILLYLRTAHECGYQRDSFIAHAPDVIRTRLTELARCENADPRQDKEFFGGIVYNNALLRMSSLFERGLKALHMQTFKRRSDRTDVDRIKTWFETTYEKPLARIDAVRKEINLFKHNLGVVKQKRQLHTFEEACDAFDELLHVLVEIKQRS